MGLNLRVAETKVVRKEKAEEGWRTEEITWITALGDWQTPRIGEKTWRSVMCSSERTIKVV